MKKNWGEYLRLFWYDNTEIPSDASYRFGNHIMLLYS